MKKPAQSSPQTKLLVIQTPLRETTNEQNIGQKRRKIGPTCIMCRETQKRRNQARRAKADEVKQHERIPWKEIVRMIEDGFCFYLFILIIHSSLSSERLLLVSDFFQELPPDVVKLNDSPTTKEERKTIAQYIVDQYSEAKGFQFQFHDEYQLSERARRYPAQFAKGHRLRFQCSQQRRVHKVSILPYGRTRNRRAKKKQFDCKGEVKVSSFRKLNL